MIKSEKITIWGREFVRTYSDDGRKIRQKETGTIYDEAVDVPGAQYTYEETPEKIEGEGAEFDG